MGTYIYHNYDRLSLNRVRDLLCGTLGLAAIFVPSLIFTFDAIGTAFFLFAALFWFPGLLALITSIYTLTPDVWVNQNGLAVKLGWRWRAIPRATIVVKKSSYGITVMSPMLPWFYLGYTVRYSLGRTRAFIIGKDVNGYEELEYDLREQGLLTE